MSLTERAIAQLDARRAVSPYRHYTAAGDALRMARLCNRLMREADAQLASILAS